MYQNIPYFVQEALGYTVEIDEKWRGDTARWHNLLENLNVEKIKSIGDIGANTGFFALSLAHRFPDIAVHAYEANPNHYYFMAAIKKQFQLKNIHLQNTLIDLLGIEKIAKQECLINFNVLHHAGVDFDEGVVELKNFSEYACDYLGCLSNKSKEMFFQMGFNWGGNKEYPIIPLQDDSGKVYFMSRIFKSSGWKIEKIFTVQKAGVLHYFEMPPEIVICLNDGFQEGKKLVHDYYARYHIETFSEFYRRPIFYCSSNAFTTESEKD